MRQEIYAKNCEMKNIPTVGELAMQIARYAGPLWCQVHMTKVNFSTNFLSLQWKEEMVARRRSSAIWQNLTSLTPLILVSPKGTLVWLTEA